MLQERHGAGRVEREPPGTRVGVAWCRVVIGLFVEGLRGQLLQRAGKPLDIGGIFEQQFPVPGRVEHVV